jgi:hypothetical protein
MRDSMYIGEGPWDEPCPALGGDAYTREARAHLARFIEQIRRHYGPEPDGGRLCIQSNPHDFGTYYSCEYVWTNDAAAEYGFAVEGDALGVLMYWDKEEVSA